MISENWIKISSEVFFLNLYKYCWKKLCQVAHGFISCLLFIIVGTHNCWASNFEFMSPIAWENQGKCCCAVWKVWCSGLSPLCGMGPKAWDFFFNNDPYFRIWMSLKANFHWYTRMLAIRCRRDEFEFSVNPRGLLKVNLTLLEQVLQLQKPLLRELAVCCE